jgi:hypothetical protein
MKIIWNQVTWYSKLLAVIFFIIIVPALTFYIGKQYQITRSINNIDNTTVINYKWPMVSWIKHISKSSKLSFDYPSGWSIMYDGIYSNKKTSSYLYPNIMICPPDYEKSLAPNGNSPSNCISFVEENTLIHPLPDDDFAGTFTYFSDFFGIDKMVSYDHYYDTNMMLSKSNYYIGFKRVGDRYTGLLQTTCLPDQSVQCLLIFRHVLDSITFEK